MKRRDFIKVAATGLTAISLGGLNLPPMFRRQQALAAHQTLDLDIVEVVHEMIDFTQVPSYAYSAPGLGPTIPGPLIVATAGHEITINLLNQTDALHSFAIEGVVASVGPISTGASVPITFTAPAPGTYIYEDSYLSPINRVLGLHGMLIVLPATGINPYGVGSGKVYDLFNDLGTAPHFPGDPWLPERTRVWIFSQVDPVLNTQIVVNKMSFSPSQFINNYEPLYWTINGISGYFAAHDHEIEVRGRIGEPTLIRNAHVGVGIDSPHIHANHGYLTAINGAVQENVWWLDTWTSSPFDINTPANRKVNTYDVLYPMVRPPDIPPDTWNKLLAGTSEEGYPFLTGASGAKISGPKAPGDDSPNPMYTADTAPKLVAGHPEFLMFYPMHSHMEQSQTAGGGSYPQGTVTHLAFTGVHPDAAQEI